VLGPRNFTKFAVTIPYGSSSPENICKIIFGVHAKLSQNITGSLWGALHCALHVLKGRGTLLLWWGGGCKPVSTNEKGFLV